MIFNASYHPHLPPHRRQTSMMLLVLIFRRMVSVEVVHPVKCFQPSIFVIHSSDATVPIYERVSRDVLDTVIDWLKGTNTTDTDGDCDALQMMCLFRVGVKGTEGTAGPCVVVMLSPGTVCDWGRLGESLGGILMKSQEQSNAETETETPRKEEDMMSMIDVEFLPGYCRASFGRA